MLKQLVRSMIVLISLVSAINAQSAQRFEIHIPFSFVLDGRSFSAGNYGVERTDPTRPNIVTLKNLDDGISSLILTQRVEKDKPSATSSLMFIQRAGKRYLFQVWNVGAMNGNQIPVPSDRKSRDPLSKNLKLVILRARH